MVKYSPVAAIRLWCPRTFLQGCCKLPTTCELMIDERVEGSLPFISKHFGRKRSIEKLEQPFGEEIVGIPGASPVAMQMTQDCAENATQQGGHVKDDPELSSAVGFQSQEHQPSGAIVLKSNGFADHNSPGIKPPQPSRANHESSKANRVLFWVKKVDGKLVFEGVSNRAGDLLQNAPPTGTSSEVELGNDSDSDSEIDAMLRRFFNKRSRDKRKNGKKSPPLKSPSKRMRTNSISSSSKTIQLVSSEERDSSEKTQPTIANSTTSYSVVRRLQLPKSPADFASTESEPSKSSEKGTTTASADASMESEAHGDSYDADAESIDEKSPVSCQRISATSMTTEEVVDLDEGNDHDEQSTQAAVSLLTIAPHIPSDTYLITVLTTLSNHKEEWTCRLHRRALDELGIIVIKLGRPEVVVWKKQFAIPHISNENEDADQGGSRATRNLSSRKITAEVKVNEQIVVYGELTIPSHVSAGTVNIQVAVDVGGACCIHSEGLLRVR